MGRAKQTAPLSSSLDQFLLAQSKSGSARDWLIIFLLEYIMSRLVREPTNSLYEEDVVWLTSTTYLHRAKQTSGYPF